MIINSAIDIPTLILMLSSSVADRADLSVSDRKRILSKASEALEINSLKKIYKFKIMYKLFYPWKSETIDFYKYISVYMQNHCGGGGGGYSNYGLKLVILELYVLRMGLTLYLFVFVEGVDDEFHHTVDLRLEYMFLRLFP